MEPRIHIFVGTLGCGKTEIAINYAMKQAAEGKKVTIVDCDIVNTYFRTLDAKEAARGKGHRGHCAAVCQLESGNADDAAGYSARL